jgi:glycosyltransferase involved in cell wall biosynthesis
VDFVDGFMGKNVPQGIDFIDIELSVEYPKNAVLVLQSLAPWNIEDINKFPSETSIFFWNLHPLNLYPYIFSIHSSNRCKVFMAKLLLPFSFLRKYKLKKLVEYLAARDSIVFMDGENYKTTAKYFPQLNIPKNILPIFSNPGSLISREPGEVLRCCWIGRIVDFKVHILLHLMERLDSATSEAGPIEITIVGDGDAAEYLKQSVNKLHNVKIKFIDYVEPEDLDNFLDLNVDVLFAMGASALEGASKGIPTFVLDFSYRPIVGLYHFRYLQEVEDCSLGEEIGISHFEATSTFENRLQKLRSNYRLIGASSYEHWHLYFSPQAIQIKFLEYIDNSTASIAEMKELGFFKADIFFSYKKCNAEI